MRDQGSRASSRPQRLTAARADNSHVEAALALHIHEVGVRALHQAMKLVLGLLQLRGGVEEIDIAREHLRVRARIK